MVFLLGIITGLLLASLSCLTTLYIAFKYPRVSRNIETRVNTFRQENKPRGEVFKQRSLKGLRADRIVKKNTDEGRDTNLNEIL